MCIMSYGLFFHSCECVVTKGCICYLVVLYFIFHVVSMSLDGLFIFDPVTAIKTGCST